MVNAAPEALQRLANRSDNLLATSILGLGGLVFGFIVFQEQDWADKVDDGGFLVVGVVIIAWYLWANHAFERSRVPVAMAVLDVLSQIAGLILEREDPKAFGDNIGGMTIAGGIAAALYARATTGETSVIDVSLLGVGAWATQFTANLAMQAGGVPPRRTALRGRRGLHPHPLDAEAQPEAKVGRVRALSPPIEIKRPAGA